jgi:hypothetical protein
VANDGSTTTNRTCAACGAGAFTTTTNAAICTGWTSCAAGSYVSSAGTTTSDRVCTPCSTGTYTSVQNQASCSPVGSCAAGTEQTAAGTTTSPTQCAACPAGTYCAGGTTAKVNCESGTWDSDQNSATACAAWTNCLPGEYVSAAGSATTNRQCTACPADTTSTTTNATTCTCSANCANGTACTSGGQCASGNCSSGTCQAAPINAWDPTDIGASLALWLDANDSSTLTMSGTSVSQWRDKSGNGCHANQATFTAQPTYSSTAFFSRPGITFDGSDDIMNVSTSAMQNNVAHGVYWVFQRVGAGAGGDVYRPEIGVWNTSATTAGAFDRGALHYVKTNNYGASYPYYSGPTNTSYDLSSGTLYANNSGQVMAFQSNTSGWGVWRNGSLEGTTNGLPTPDSTNHGYNLGGQIYNSRRANIVFSEVFMASSTNTTIRQRTEGYLAHKWGLQDSLPSDHLYKNAPPTKTAWGPAQLGSALALWFDANDAATLTFDGTNVAQWNDKSGNARHLTQSATAQRPAYSATAFSGRPTVTFDGSNDCLSTTNAGALNVTDVSFLMVMRYVSATGEDVPFGLGSTNNTRAIRVMYRANGGTTLGFATWANDIGASSLSTDTGGGYHLVEAIQSASNVFLWRNGTADTTSPRVLPNAPVAVNQNGATLGSLQGSSVGTYYSNISVSEVIAIYSAITATPRQAIEGYLAHKWGLQGNLPATHPYKNGNPLTRGV